MKTIRPVLSEKAYAISSAANKYVFMCGEKMTKTEIKNLIEKEYSVKVIAVNTQTLPGKAKRNFKNYKNYREADRIKAIVTLKDGDKISNLFEE